MTSSANITQQEALDILHASTPKAVLEVYNEPYMLNKKQIRQYRNNGFITLKKVLYGEVLSYARNVITAAVEIRKEHDKRTLAEKSQYEQSFLQCGYLCWDFPAIRDIVFGKRFAWIARDLMTSKDVRLWHDQALFKEPSGRVTDVHIDSSYWPMTEPEKSITLWLALTDVPKEKGSLFFYKGSHKLSSHEYVDIFNNPHLPEELLNKDSEVVHSALSAGDATFHSGLTYHGANANQTNDMRKAMTVIYIEDGVHFDASDPRNAAHTSCEGLQDGAKIDTKYTPILS